MALLAPTPIRHAAEEQLRRALARSPVVALVGPRQCGKTTLARRLVAADAANYFDLEDPVSLARLDQPRTALQDLAGVVVIDEVQHRPELFPVLRVLVDRDGSPARLLVLGSAGPALLRQSAESLAGRIEYVELSGFQVAELGPDRMETLWVRGGFPRSVLAANDADSMAWRKAYLRSLVERDLPQFGADLRPPALHRFLTMLAHYHGRILNVAELAAALQIGQATVRRYLDLLEQLFLIRQLRPWHENLRKRQVKRPKLYFRDPGLYHHLIGIDTRDALETHPRLGASWEGFILEKVIAESGADQVHFWATHNGAELDLLLVAGGRRVGVEIKRVDAPRRTRSMAVALEDLKLDALRVVYPGTMGYDIGDRIAAVPAREPFRPFGA
ncbi:MAG: ATP-binding protein [Acidobacteria bacterium]|nr:ATP-binding protein [Acidobacteriota bacterium]